MRRNGTHHARGEEGHPHPSGAGQDGVTLSAVGAASATAPVETLVETTRITEATVIEVEA